MNVYKTKERIYIEFWTNMVQQRHLCILEWINIKIIEVLSFNSDVLYDKGSHCLLYCPFLTGDFLPTVSSVRQQNSLGHPKKFWVWQHTNSDTWYDNILYDSYKFTVFFYQLAWRTFSEGFWFETMNLWQIFLWRVVFLLISLYFFYKYYRHLQSNII